MDSGKRPGAKGIPVPFEMVTYLFPQFQFFFGTRVSSHFLSKAGVLQLAQKVTTSSHLDTCQNWNKQTPKTMRETS